MLQFFSFTGHPLPVKEIRPISQSQVRALGQLTALSYIKYLQIPAFSWVIFKERLNRLSVLTNRSLHSLFP